jgi:LacI family transcriptional regulator/LacI family asc operon transcriptional repressor
MLSDEVKKEIMNIYDISKAAGVSIASVSRVINGAENVSEKTRQKVLAIIDQYGYTPNAYARGLGRGSMKTIGIMCSDASDIYLANAIYFLETELRQNGYNSILCCSGYDLENKKASFELLKSRQVDAVIMAGSKYVEMNDEDNAYVIEGARDFPVMLLNGDLDAPNIYSTCCDDRGGMKNAVIKLHESGARNILYVYSSESYSGIKKIEGIRAGMKECGLPDDAVRILKGKKDFKDIADLLQEEYRKAPFDAIIASSDTSGVGAMKFAIREKLKVPEELQIVSFNNSVLAESTNPELTSIDSKLETLCQHTVKTLLQVLSASDDELPDISQKKIIETEMIIRGTTRFS